MNGTVPRVVIAAPASGHGKTSVATGLLAAFAARGLSVSPHKVGPDYIDPSYHALAAGRPGRNLDPWLTGEELIAPLFLHGVAKPKPADIAIVEGVMGLFDGRTDDAGSASTAHVAALLRAPVLMVVDASAQAHSIGALLHGFATFDPEVRLAGVILNRVGSARHERVLREAAAAVGVPVAGAVRRQDRLAAPSRHLGLVPAAERGRAASRTVAELGESIAASVDLEMVLRIARSAGPIAGRAWDPIEAVGRRRGAAQGRPIVSVAGGSAFTFSYAEHGELLSAAGAEVAVVDPLRDEQLPDGAAGLVIGGGFPELHREALAGNVALREQILARARDGMPIAAECGGLLYLAESLDGSPMCGVLPCIAAMTGRPTLGYREARAAAGSVLTSHGSRARGHEFHHTVCRRTADARPAWLWARGGSEGFLVDNVHASYLHLHWAGRPSIARRLVRFAAAQADVAGGAA